MNNRMWDNHFVQRNVISLGETGVNFVGPTQGKLAERPCYNGENACPWTEDDDAPMWWYVMGRGMGMICQGCGMTGR